MCGAGPLTVALVRFSVGGHAVRTDAGAFVYAPSSYEPPHADWCANMEAELKRPEGHHTVLAVESAVSPRGVSVYPSMLGR